MSPSRTWPRDRLYPLAGICLALGAPLGLLAVHAAASGAWPGPAWIAHTIAGDPITWAYTTVSTMVVFVVLGWMVGRQEDELERSSVTDMLTGLFNRRHVTARLRAEVARSLRHGAPLSLLVVDVDDLKGLNDREGHAAGDAALGEVADALRATCRVSDIAARLGGDEFAVVAPSTSGHEAVDLASRLRDTLIARAQAHRNEEGRPCVSIGIAELARCDAPVAEEMFRAADRALYQAKADGRDRARLSPLPGAATRGDPTTPLRTIPRKENDDAEVRAHPGAG